MNIKPIVQTPSGSLSFVIVDEPREGKFGKAWEANITCPLAESEKLMEDIGDEIRIQAEANGVDAEGARLPYIVDLETDTVRFKFKRKAEGTKKEGTTWKADEAPPLTVNGEASKARVGNGSKGQIVGAIKAYYSDEAGLGASLQLRSVDVAELVEYTPKREA